LIEGFRGFAKSTYLEETAVLKAVFKEFHNLVIVGASLTRACERLFPIKNELLNNEALLSLTGPLQGEVWRDDKIVLANGVAISAMGRDQAMTGMKHGDWRPDAALVDDVEDPEEVRTDADREKTWNWFIKVFLPGLDHPLYSWVRVLGTRRGNGSLPERLEKDAWPTAKFPIEYLDDDGRRAAVWPAKFPLFDIDKIKQTYRGDMHTYMQEYMCEASSEVDRVFRRETMRCEPRVRSWQAVYAMYDPARTTNRTSATTGKAVWSWQGSRLTVWELKAERWAPDELVRDILDTNRLFAPVWLGVEKTGLNDWIMQPLRAAAGGGLLPILPVEAPRGKLDFIRGLQPFFGASEVVFAGTEAGFKDGIEQLLSFPAGRIDAPNALAYAVILKPGAPIYDGFSDEHIHIGLEAWDDHPLFLAANTDASCVAAQLCQRRNGEIRILADWLREGSPDTVVGDIAADAALATGATTQRTRTVYGEGGDLYKLPITESYMAASNIRWVVPPGEFNTWNNHGLVQAIRRIPHQVSAGGEPGAARPLLSDALLARRGGGTLIQVSDRAGWTLRALSGGYARPLGRRGMAQVEAETGIYRVLMEGLEAFVGAGAATVAEGEVVDEQPIAYTRGGMAYRSAIPDRTRR
jgi:hypothetical protein